MWNGMHLPQGLAAEDVAAAWQGAEGNGPAGRLRYWAHKPGRLRLPLAFPQWAHLDWEYVPVAPPPTKPA